MDAKRRLYSLYSLALLQLFLAGKTSAIRCSICGQSNLTAPGECTNQFQYDCSTDNNDGRQSNRQRAQPGKIDSKILCRTTRTKLGENLFAVAKECVTENEHLNRYPEGRAFGCETVQANGSYPITYCVCDQDMCNARSLDEQAFLAQQGGANTPLLQTAQEPNQTRQPLRPLGRSRVNPQAGQQQQQQQPNWQASQASQNLPSTQFQQGPPNQQQQQLPNLLQLNDGVAIGFSPTLPLTVVNPNSNSNPNPPQNQNPRPGLVPNPHPGSNPTTNHAQPTINTAAVQEPFTVDSNTPQVVTAGSTVNWSPQVPAPRTHQPQNHPPSTTPLLLVPLNTERVEFLPDSTTITRPVHAANANSSINNVNSASFACMVCGEGNLTSGQDCQIQNPLECRSLFPPGSTLYCFTRTATLPTGEMQVEKRCASEDLLKEELGLQNVQPSCYNGQDQHLQLEYCLCGTSKCNQLPISTQAHMYPPISPVNPKTSATSPLAPETTENQTKMCFVCGESDQSHPSDCSQQYEYDCTRQYPPGSTILCLTRQTKVASGRFNIEKRCITPAEHQQQYPDNDVTLNGCNEAWSGYVQYCVCQGDFCNGPNITLQQKSYNWVQIPQEEQHEDESSDSHDEIQEKADQNRYRGGLLSPPSTRLPIAPARVSTVKKIGTSTAKTDTITGNAVHEDAPREPAEISSTETLSPWAENRIHANAKSRPISSKRNGETPPADEANSSTKIRAWSSYLILALSLSLYQIMQMTVMKIM